MQINTKERYNAAANTTNTTPDTEDAKTERASDKFKQLVAQMIEDHKLNKNNIQVEDDWRKMSDAQWDKLIEHIDEYIDDTREELEERKKLQEEAAQRGAAEAPADMKAVAAAMAALKAAANGISVDVSGNTAADIEKLSWTYELDTEDQTVLTKAKMANEYADSMLTKAQELALTGDTSTGISESEEVKESASFTEDEENHKTWTVTVYTKEGIICTEYKDGVKKELWRIEYQNPNDYQKVWDFLSELGKDEDLTFAGSKSFWENFITK